MEELIKIQSLTEAANTKYKQALQTLCEEWNYHPFFISSLRGLVGEYCMLYKDNITPNQKVHLLLSLFMEIKKELKVRGSYSMQKKEIEKTLELYLCEIPFHFTTQKDLDFLMEANAEFPQVDSFKMSTEKPPHLFSFDIKNEVDDWLSKWMIRPHFARYKNYYDKIENKEAKTFLADRIIEELHKQIAHRPIRRTLFQIVSFHQRYEQGIDLWNLSPCDPLTLSMEEQQFFKLVSRYSSHLVIPLYMQWIERLIEKKTKKHYELSITLLAEVQAVMRATDSNERFQLFLQVLQKRYKGYSALQKELKQFDDKSK